MTASDARRPGLDRPRRHTVATVLTLAVAFVVVEHVIMRYEANVATSTAHELAEPVDRLCRDHPSARREIGAEDCDRAADVQRRSTTVVVPRDGTNGRDGATGRDVAGTAVVDGRLLVTYTDGQRDDLGPVVGATGAPGPVGPEGPVGRGVVGTTVNADGELQVTYTDGTSETLGHVVGADGAPGRGVARVEARDGRLLVFYDDEPDVAVDVGSLPVARGIVTLDLDMNRCVVTVRYTDDAIDERPVGGCVPVTSSPPPPDDGS